MLLFSVMSARRFLVATAILLGSLGSLLAQAPKSLSSSTIWSDVNEGAMVAARGTTAAAAGVVLPKRDIVPLTYRTVQLKRAALEELLKQAPPEFSVPASVYSLEIDVPMPYGNFSRFRIEESPIMEPGLAKKYPEIKTYIGQGIDDPTASMRIDVTPRGFHAIVLSPHGQYYIDPYWSENDETYISYYKRNFMVPDKRWTCGVSSKGGAAEPAASRADTAQRPTGATLRVYRLALACTAEYAAAVSGTTPGTVPQALAAMVTSINRCSAVYERDLSIRFVLVNNTDKLIFTNIATEPFTNSNGSTMLGQNQTTVDSIIGSANYDIGHVFSTGGGGVADLGVICRAGLKAQGVTGTSNPVGDPYDIDYVVHEMGHQFGANHPFNGTATPNCSGGNRNASTAYEPGSGTTIMAYAGICSPQNLAPHSDDYFHTISYDEIDAYTGSGSGSTCPTTIGTGNHPPVISALSNFTIPSQTPFALTASATDQDSDTLTYCWEEFDLGPAQDPTAAPRDNGSSPIFRSFDPSPSPTRLFPSLTYILSNQNIPPATLPSGFISAEFLPTTSRTLTFRVTVRDNRLNGGGSNYASMTVTSVATAGPFAITGTLNAAGTFAGGSTQTVTWNVANTNASPINCANVKISLSTDGGNTFPFVLAASVPNNGTASVTLPSSANVATTQGRIKVEAVGNIFFDISDTNFTVTSTFTPPALSISPSGITVARGTPTPTVAVVGTSATATGVAVSNLPGDVNVTPSIAGGNISLSVLANCTIVTTLTSRTYPILLTVTDSHGSTTSGTVNLNITPNPAPTIGTYSNANVGVSGGTVNVTPSAGPADANNNLIASPFTVLPTTLPGGGTISINQATGVVTATTTASSALGTTAVRVTLVDSCGAAAVRIFNVTVVSLPPAFTDGPPPSPLTVGTPYSFSFTATGSPAPTFAVTGGALPPGLLLSSAGVLSGTPTSAGTGSFPNITVTASNGVAPNATQTFGLNAVTLSTNYIASFGLTGGNAALNFDYDRDGLANLLEYALGLDPTKPGPTGMPVAQIKSYAGVPYVYITFPRSSVATDLTYIVEASTDLQTWTNIASSSGGAVTSGPGFVGETGAAPTFTVEVRDIVPVDPVNGPKRFLRLRVTTP
jgi:Metallo-peptidase family M12B Reprolysin-like